MEIAQGLQELGEYDDLFALALDQHPFQALELVVLLDGARHVGEMLEVVRVIPEPKIAGALRQRLVGGEGG